jgi:2-polyprenyl-3-methyl-5-hydroxy-6-metoxy-1,4-benzoquinol methylase
MGPQEIQESQYGIPYHYLPWEWGGIWHVGRFLGWGFEYLALLNTVLELVEKSLQYGQRQMKVLDFGCGDGRLIAELVRKNPCLGIVAGVDISERALTFAKAATWGNPRVYFFSDIATAFQKIGQFDIVVAMEVLEHIPPENLSDIVAQLHNALIENGWLIVSVPTDNIPLNRKHYQHFTLQTLIQVFIDYFSLQDVHYIH